MRRLLVAMRPSPAGREAAHGRVAAVGREQHRAAHGAAVASCNDDLARFDGDRRDLRADRHLRLRRFRERRRPSACAAACPRRCGRGRARRCRALSKSSALARERVVALPHAHAPIRRGARARHALPDAELLEQLLRRARQRVDARVELVVRASAATAARRARARGRDPRSAPSRAARRP